MNLPGEHGQWCLCEMRSDVQHWHSWIYNWKHTQWFTPSRPQWTACFLISLALCSWIKCYKMWLHLNATKVYGLCHWWLQRQTLLEGDERIWMAERLVREKLPCQILSLRQPEYNKFLSFVSSVKYSFSCLSLYCTREIQVQRYSQITVVFVNSCTWQLKNAWKY